MNANEDFVRGSNMLIMHLIGMARPLSDSCMYAYRAPMSNHNVSVVPHNVLGAPKRDPRP